MNIGDHIKAIKEADECEIMEYPFDELFGLLAKHNEVFIECIGKAVGIANCSEDKTSRMFAVDIAVKLMSLTIVQD